MGYIFICQGKKWEDRKVNDAGKKNSRPEEQLSGFSVQFAVDHLITWIQPSGASMRPIWMPVRVS